MMIPWDHQCLTVSSILGGSALSREKSPAWGFSCWTVLVTYQQVNFHSKIFQEILIKKS